MNGLTNTIRSGIAAVVVGVATTAATVAHAAWPEQPIQIIVPYGVGGAPDIFTRMIAQALAPRLGQPIVIENRGGAGGNIATQLAYRAKPDGYTLLFSNNATLATNQFLFKDLPYDPTRFTSIRGLYKSPNLLLVSTDAPFQDLAGLIAYGRQNPEKLNFGSPGIGTSSHLSGELLKALTGIGGRHVPYRASPEALQSLAAGNIQFVFSNNVSTTISMIDAGKVRAIAITSSTRSALFPDVPTMAQAGVPGYVMDAWGGLSGPPDMPQAIVDRLVQELDVILASPQIKARMDQLMFIALDGGPQAYDRLQEEERAILRTLIQKSGALAN